MVTSKDLQIFQTDCLKASKWFVLFEKALPEDKKSAIDRIKKLQIPDKFAKQWELVLVLCEDFAEYPAININAYPLKEAFRISGEQQIITTSEQFISLLEHIAKSKIQNIDLDGFLTEHNKIREARLFCKKVISLLERINASVPTPSQKTTIIHEFGKISRPEGFECIFEFINSILADYFENESVDLSTYDFPDGITIPIPPYPVRGISGIIDIIKAIAIMETFPIGTAECVCDVEEPQHKITPAKRHAVAPMILITKHYDNNKID